MSLPLAGELPVARPATRSRWNEHQAAHAAALKIALLSSYAVDPISPHLRAGLTEAGWTPSFHIGPHEQVEQQCLDERSPTAAFEPDILVVAQRLEELPRSSWTAGLLDVAGAALDASRRWQATLIAVLPALPDATPGGVGGESLTTGHTATAVAAREAMRTALSGRPNVHVVDLETVIRSVGAVHAHDPALFRHATVPYRDEVFRLLGGRITRILRSRLGDVHQAAAVDLRGFADLPDADDLGSVVRWLRSAEVPVHLLGDHDAIPLWRELAAGSAELDGDWIFDERAPAGQLAEIASQAGLAVRDFAVLTREADCLMVHTGSTTLNLGKDAEFWPERLAAAALFDRIPVARAHIESAAASAVSPVDVLSLHDFVAGLSTEVKFRPADHGDVDTITAMLSNTKDFTLGLPRTAEEISAALGSEEHQVLMGAVHDRLGDLGTSVALVLRRDGGDCVVEVFLVSCPALGKDVEQIVLRRITDHARDWGCDRTLLHYVRTGRNQAAIDFLDSVAGPGLVVGAAAELQPEGAGTPC